MLALRDKCAHHVVMVPQGIPIDKILCWGGPPVVVNDDEAPLVTDNNHVVAASPWVVLASIDKGAAFNDLLPYDFERANSEEVADIDFIPPVIDDVLKSHGDLRVIDPE